MSASGFEIHTIYAKSDPKCAYATASLSDKYPDYTVYAWLLLTQEQ